MTFTIRLNESSASRRALPMWLLASDGTSAATVEADNDIDMQVGGVFYPSVGSISAVSAAQGSYVGIFNASKLSVLGPGELLYGSSAVALDFSAPFQIISADPYDDYMISHGAAAQSGGAQEIRLASTETTTNDIFNGSVLLYTHADGTKEANVISDYTGSNRSCFMQSAWAKTPTTGVYSIFPGTQAAELGEVWDAAASAHSTVGSFGQVNAPALTGTAASGAAQEIRLTGGVATDNFYNNSAVKITRGTGAGQTGEISNYTGSNTSAAMTNAWTTAPDGTSEFVVIPIASLAGGTVPTAAANADAVWDEARADHTASGSYGQFTFSQATGTSGGTVQGVLHAVYASEITGTLNTFDDLNNIDGSGVTLHAGTHSDVTIQAATQITSQVSLLGGSYSDVTIGATLEAATASGVTLHAGTHSNATVAGVSNVAAIATAGRTAIARSFMSLDVGNSRIVQEYLWPLRNRVEVEGSVVTIYKPDDTTSAWTGSVTTSYDALSGVNPLG